MNTKLNNKGMSLIELLVVMAIASIVSLLIITMMSEGTSMFSKESKKIDLQNEIQVVQNQLTEKFMEAKAINVVKCGDSVRIYTGKVNTTTNGLEVEGESGYTDSIITYQDGNLYVTGTYMQDIPDGYLLSGNVMAFKVDIATDAESETELVINEDGSSSMATTYYYDNPISIKLTMTIGTEHNNKDVDMTIKLRNKIDEYNIYEVSDFYTYLSGVTPTTLDIR